MGCVGGFNKHCDVCICLLKEYKGENKKNNYFKSPKEKTKENNKKNFYKKKLNETLQKMNNDVKYQHENEQLLELNGIYQDDDGSVIEIEIPPEIWNESINNIQSSPIINSG